MMRPPLSVQLYTVREQLTTDPAGTMEALATMGFTAVEPYGLDALEPAVAHAVREQGLTVPTAHGAVIAQTAVVLETATALGCQTVIEPWQPASAFADRDGIAAIAQSLNDAAVQAADQGMTVGYHNHDHELRQLVEGVPALLLLAELTDERVQFELDAYWCAVAGADPVHIARSLGDRLVAVHAKDGDPHADVSAQVAAGAGSVPIAATLAAAPHARAIVEFDLLPASGMDAIAESLRYLRALENQS